MAEPNEASALQYMVDMFGSVVNPDVIETILQSCGGDVSLAIDALLALTNGGGITELSEQELDQPSEALVSVTMSQNVNETDPSHAPYPVSYAIASQSKGAYKKTVREGRTPIHNNKVRQLSEQLRRIVEYHKSGYRTLIIMRGVPGSGKSTLARQLVEITVGPSPINFKAHIFSTDDYFLCNGKTYFYDVTRLSEAHDWNQRNVRKNLSLGLSPVIVDNTHVQCWEMAPYVQAGVQNGYFIEIVEPNTPWAKKASELAKKSIHNVPYGKIIKMLDLYERHYSPDHIINTLGLSYPSYLIPPVMRKTPALPTYSVHTTTESTATNLVDISSSTLIQTEEPMPNAQDTGASNTSMDDTKVTDTVSYTRLEISETIQNKNQPTNSGESVIGNPQSAEDVRENQPVNSKVTAAQGGDKEPQNDFVEIEKITLEWESGAEWVEPVQSQGAANQTSFDVGPKPQREPRSREHSRTRSASASRYLPTSTTADNAAVDWQIISSSVPAWDHDVTHKVDEPKPLSSPEKTTSSTAVESGDHRVDNSNFRVMSARARDINFLYIPPATTKIPHTIMLDKSSMTNDSSDADLYRCKNEDKHFIAFRKMFHHIAKAELRDIFDKCGGNVNWASEVVLDGAPNSTIAFSNTDEHNSDSDECNVEMCDCVSAYNLVPRTTESAPIAVQATPLVQADIKKKKDKTLSESSIQLIRQIEQNVNIPDHHYSNNSLKIKKLKAGNISKEMGVFCGPSTSQGLSELSTSQTFGESSINQSFSGPSMDQALSGPSVDQALSGPSTGQPFWIPTSTLSHEVLRDHDANYGTQPSNTSNKTTTSISDEDFNADGSEETVNVTLGADLINQLKVFYPDCKIDYAENVVPVVSMPRSLLDQIYALWLESLAHQIQTQTAYTDILIKEDEQLARQLAEQEEELTLAGRKPEVPDFREIMDMDLALSLYDQQVKELSKNEPTDMAAKLSRDKLYNLFPDCQKEVLSELLLAHDNNFQKTVEGLLVSTGRTELLLEKNGINKWVMEKEMQRQQEAMEEARQKELDEEEWPILDGASKQTQMETVTAFRDEAQKHLEQRNLNHHKAQAYFSRGMTQVAGHYAEMASFHKQKCEQANSKAACSLIQLHSTNKSNATLDLHYLFVKEALQTLDLFLDHHIQRLSSAGASGARLNNSLFVITGRGVHSRAGPRIKPAVKRRLQQRGLSSLELNPGLLSVGITADDKLTHQIQ